MKRIICLLTAVVLLLCGCQSASENAFTISDNGNIVSKNGTEYAFLANEGVLYYLGDLEFVGSVSGEPKTSQHLGISYQTGMFKIINAENDNILIRCAPNDEWFAIYRKVSLSEFDFSVDNCVRLEFVLGTGNISGDAVHTTCGDGITDKSEISDFLSDVRLQENPHDAGLYDMIRKPNGMLENCYIYGVIYGFFGEEPNVVIEMPVTSYNDLAYSVRIGAEEYVLPEEWLEEFVNN